MRVVVVWRDNTEYAREVISWMEEFERATGKSIESLSPDSIDGEIFVRARDIMQYPTVVVVKDDGIVVREFKGTPLPQFEDVSYFLG